MATGTEHHPAIDWQNIETEDAIMANYNTGRHNVVRLIGKERSTGRGG